MRPQGTVVALVLLSATFHTLIRSNLQATLRMTLQSTSLDDELDSSASARVSHILTEAVQRNAAGPAKPAPSRVAPAPAAADVEVTAVAVDRSPPPSLAVEPPTTVGAPEAACAPSAAAAACAACELRLLHWNLQNKPGRPDLRQLAAVLALAKAKRCALPPSSRPPSPSSGR